MLEIFEVIDSTNDYLKRKKEKKNYDAALAHMQNKGRGRSGRVWLSSREMLMFSIVIKEDKNISMMEYLKLPLVIGGALLHTLKNIEELPFKFKWTNDIYLYDKKLSGILVEKVNDEFIVGVGLNLNHEDFGDLSEIATSMYIHSNRKYNKVEVANKIIENIKLYVNNFYRGLWLEILGEINLDNYLDGKKIEFYSSGKIYKGIGKKIDKEGDMVFEVEGGEIMKFKVGEASTQKPELLV